MKIKLKNIRFINHKILKNLYLDFTDGEGNIVDTVIFAGENGTGKSTILNAIYEILNEKNDFESDVTIEYEGKEHFLSYRRYNNNHIKVSDGEGLSSNIFSNPLFSELRKKYKLSAIYSDVEINFTSADISSVTSMSLDREVSYVRSDSKLSQQTKQLLIDIQALDDAELSKACRENQDKKCSELNVNLRMDRFTSAFDFMFNDLKYDCIKNSSGKKIVYFKKNKTQVPIDNLSSGEKQIVFRGCFMLKDINSLNGAFVFIDEPEISLHPSWQKNILDFYKKIFTDKEGKQSSQIFVVTHSPFIIHNEKRKNDKVLVLTLDHKGIISVIDKPEYYKCNSIEVVEDAFSCCNLTDDVDTVFLEGRTDEQYFQKALKVFNLENNSIRFKWIGHLDNNQERFTGCSCLNQTYDFLSGQKLNKHHICLFDCDTKHDEKNCGKAHTRTIPFFENRKNIKKGIENALVLDDIDLTPFYSVKNSCGDYGEEKIIQEFEKMKLCKYICELDDDQKLRKVLLNLKTIIENMINICNSK